jgi:hypothetical protein
VLFEGSTAATDAVLRAMKHVACAGGARVLTDTDRLALTAAHTVVFLGTGTLDPDALPDITPEELAGAVPEPASREHCAAFLAVMATVDGVVDAAHIDTASRYVASLRLHEPFLRDLTELAQRKLAEVRADIGRRNVRAFTGRDTDEGIDAWIGRYRDHPDPRGDKLTGDTLSPEWNFGAHVDAPLATVRHEMGVPALDPADAADGKYPDWYEPTA